MQLKANNLAHKSQILMEGAKRPTEIWFANGENTMELNDINDFYDFYLNAEPESFNNVVNVVKNVTDELQNEVDLIIQQEREAIETESLELTEEIF
jgi:hypothetical protein